MVGCDSCATRDEVLFHSLLPPERLVVIRNTVHPTCSPAADPICDDYITTLLGPPSPQALDLLHVGSTIPRKRIDQLLRVFATVREQIPLVRLVRVGGAFNRAQRDLLQALQLINSVIELPYLTRRELAAVYRRATILLLPSEAEGFGLPVIEAMASGTPVVASDILALREVGGSLAAYCDVGNITGWSKAILDLVAESRERKREWQARKSAGVWWAERFSAKEYAARTVSIYREVAGA